MQVTLEVHETFFDKFLHVVDALPKGMVSLTQDKMTAELVRRLEAIDRDEEELTPYRDGMDAMLERLTARYADR